MNEEQDTYRLEPLKASRIFDLQDHPGDIWYNYWTQNYFEKNEALKNLLISVGVTQRTADEYEISIDQRGELLEIFHVRKVSVWKLGRD